MLLVEDNPVALHLIEKITVEAGCQITAVTNGEQALELVKVEHFDLIITDIGLPGISGIELTQSIRQWESDSAQSKPILIVGLTALPVAQMEETCFKSGMDKVLSKPIRSKAMHELLHDLFPEAKQTVQEPTRNNKPMIEPSNAEAELFQLDQFLLLDINQGIINVGDEKLLKELLQVMVDKAIPEDRLYLQKAYENQNWNRIDDLVHKMTAGTLYCGTIKLQYACLHLERYHKAGHTALLEKLYQQLLQVMHETELHIIQWLRHHKTGHSRD